jgi:hypothetical protein
MAHANKVIRSINDGDGLRCVDVFQCPDGGYGFEEYRRDPEDGRGWAPIGHQAARVFDSAGAALAAAREAVGWLGERGPVPSTEVCLPRRFPLE